VLLSARQVLGLPSFRAADVEVLAGDVDAARVRWVHSSEVYEMGSLLAGGELLLTTGLGLHGRTTAQLAGYVDLLADAGCVGVGIELGRSMHSIPEAMVEAAGRRGLLLLAIHAVVPFERMVEDFHELLLREKLGSSRSGEARAGEALWRDLLAIVVAGDGLRVLLDEVSRAAGCVVELLDNEGRVVERSRIASAVSSGSSTSVEVRGPHGARGSLVLRTRPGRRVLAVADRAAIAVALELGRHPDLERRPSLAQSVLSDLNAQVLVSRGDVERRLVEAGMTLHHGQHLLVAAVDAGRGTPVGDLVSPVRTVWAEIFGPVVAGVVGQQVVVLAPGGPRPHPGRVREMLEDAQARLHIVLPRAQVLVAAAPPTLDLAEAGAAVGRARETVRLGLGYGIHAGVLMARDMGVQRLLSTGVEPERLAAFVREQLGLLIDHDRTHESDLVRTLDAYLASGLSKSGCAELLGIRRQTLYARLARIERVLGISLADAGHLVETGLALTAWRMRTGVDPQAAFERSPRKQPRSGKAQPGH
jgi:purine catabolism regulator